MIKTPELEKIKAVSEKSQSIGEFLDWLQNQGIHTAKYVHDVESEEEILETVYLDREKILAKYFNIDLKKAEQERQKILGDLRKRG